MAGRADWSLRYVRERCALLRQTLEAEAGATADEIESITPGGRDNPDRGYTGWMYCYTRLTFFHGRSALTTGPSSTARAEAVVTDALQDTPLPVSLPSLPDGAPSPLQVYPKSLAALVELRLIDRRLTQLAASAHVFANSADESDRLFANRCEQVHVELQGLAVWIVTTPGPALPYPWDTPEPDCPAWTREMMPADLLAVLQAHLIVNFGRLKLLDDLLMPDDGKSLRPTWAGWFSSEASERSTDAVRLMRERSLGSLLAQRALTNDVARRGHAAASKGR